MFLHTFLSLRFAQLAQTAMHACCVLHAYSLLMHHVVGLSPEWFQFSGHVKGSMHLTYVSVQNGLERNS
jgi:hypothetical protein